jgi:hypothetical protein
LTLGDALLKLRQLGISLILALTQLGSVILSNLELAACVLNKLVKLGQFGLVVRPELLLTLDNVCVGLCETLNFAA